MRYFDLTDEITDENADALVEALKSANGVEDLTINLDSVGGDVFSGLRVIKAIENFKGEVTANCGVVVASMAAIIALACPKITVNKSTFLMLHEPWTVAVGNAEELMNTATLLEQAGKRCKEIVAERTDCDVEEWFKGETWFGFQAIMENFKNVLAEEEPTSYKSMTSYAKLQNKPQELVQLLASLEKPVEPAVAVVEAIEPEPVQVVAEVDNSYAQSVLERYKEIG